MLARWRRGRGRRGVAWTLVAALLFSAVAGPGLHRADAMAADLAALPLCAPDGGPLFLQPDGTLADAPARPAAEHGHDCPECVLCVAASTPAGLAAAGLATGTADYPAGQDRTPRAADERVAPPSPFVLRPPAQGPPAAS